MRPGSEQKPSAPRSSRERAERFWLIGRVTENTMFTPRWLNILSHLFSSLHTYPVYTPRGTKYRLHGIFFCIQPCQSGCRAIFIQEDTNALDMDFDRSVDGVNAGHPYPCVGSPVLRKKPDQMLRNCVLCRRNPSTGEVLTHAGHRHPELA